MMTSLSTTWSDTCSSSWGDVWGRRTCGWGTFTKGPPIRHKDSKYHVPDELYPWPSYPDYTAAYVVSAEVASKIPQVTLLLDSSIHRQHVQGHLCQSHGCCPAGTRLLLRGGKGSQPSLHLRSHDHIPRPRGRHALTVAGAHRLTRQSAAPAVCWLVSTAPLSESYACVAASTYRLTGSDVTGDYSAACMSCKHSQCVCVCVRNSTWCL